MCLPREVAVIKVCQPSECFAKEITAARVWWPGTMSWHCFLLPGAPTISSMVMVALADGICKRRSDRENSPDVALCPGRYGHDRASRAISVEPSLQNRACCRQGNAGIAAACCQCCVCAAAGAAGGDFRRTCRGACGGGNTSRRKTSAIASRCVACGGERLSAVPGCGAGSGGVLLRGRRDAECLGVPSVSAGVSVRLG